MRTTSETVYMLTIVPASMEDLARFGQVDALRMYDVPATRSVCRAAAVSEHMPTIRQLLEERGGVWDKGSALGQNQGRLMCLAAREWHVELQDFLKTKADGKYDVTEVLKAASHQVDMLDHVAWDFTEDELKMVRWREVFTECVRSQNRPSLQYMLKWGIGSKTELRKMQCSMIGCEPSVERAAFGRWLRGRGE